MGAVFWVEVLKVGTPDVGSKPFTLQGEAGSYTFPPNYGLPRSGSGFMDHISASPAHFSVDFSVHLMCRSHSASFWIAFRGSCPVCGR